MASLKAFMTLMTGGYASGINKVIKDTDKATNKILDASGVVDKFNKDLNSIDVSANTASNGIGKLVKTVVSLAALKKGIDVIDEYTNIATRLSLINDGLQTQEELQNKIFAAANRSRGAYSDMASAVAKMGLLAKDAFAANDELIAFTELVQKSFKVSGADTSEQQGAMRQLSQAMASGRLQGDELVSVMENAPMIYDAIAKYMGKTKGELKKLSSEGVITSDIIKNAIFMAADDINTKFEDMPNTFGDIWNKIKNGALHAFGPVIEKVNALINTEGFQDFVSNLINAFNLVAGTVSWLIDVIINGWDTIGPILAVIAGVVLTAIIAKIWGVVAALFAQGAATLIALWPLLLIIGVIAIAIAAARQLGATWEEVFGFIGGVIGTFVTFFYNVFVTIWNVVAAFINFFGNVFNNPIASIKTLFLDLVVTVLGFIEKIAKGIEDLLNKIPGVNVNITSGITSLKDKLTAKSAEIKSEAELKTYVQSKEFMDFSEGFEKGSNIGKDLVNKIGNAFDMSGISTDKGFDMSQFGTSQNPLNVEGKVKVEMSDEDLRYLREIAERDFINKFTTATLAPNVTFNFGDIHETADIEVVRKELEAIMREEIAISAEGSY